MDIKYTTQFAIDKLNFSNLTIYENDKAKYQFHKLCFNKHDDLGYHFLTLEDVNLILNDNELYELSTKGLFKGGNSDLEITKWR